MINSCRPYFQMRLTHMPTGISVQTGDYPPERSMHKTKEILMKFLKSKIWFSQQQIDLSKEVRAYVDEPLLDGNSDEILNKAFREHNHE